MALKLNGVFSIGDARKCYAVCRYLSSLKDSAALHTDVTRATCPRAPREMFKGLLIDVARDVPRRISYVRQRSAGALCIRGLRSRS